MSKERLEEANKWLVRIKSLSTTKSNKEDAEYVNKHAEILEGLIEQNKRYREAVEIFTEDYEWLKEQAELVQDQQATIDRLSMAHDAIYREMPKDKHTLIKNIIGLNGKVQELEEECSGWKEASRFNDAELEKQNKRYREALEFYANEDNWVYGKVQHIVRGKKAQKALEGKK